MLHLGDADSIIVTKWTDGAATRVLIDGGNRNDSEKVLVFLAKNKIKYIDHIVCTHPHNDHAGGLIGIVKSNAVDFGKAWIHLPWNHVDYGALSQALTRSEGSAKRVVRIVRASLSIAQELVTEISAKQKPIFEPFKGLNIGPLFVCGPRVEFYEALLKDFSDFSKLDQMEGVLAAHEQYLLHEELMQSLLIGGKSITEEGAGLGEAPTEPENNSSTILWASHEKEGCLFTADAGVEALTLAKTDYTLSNLKWMQISHHGSRRNVNKELIEYFKPTTAFVSADGTKKHPRRAVVNAFKAVGTTVYSTHYPTGGDLRFNLGSVPVREGYVSAKPLYDT